jgi:hypothetical protein
MRIKFSILLIAFLAMGDLPYGHTHPDASVGAVRVTLMRDISVPRSQLALLIKIRNWSDKPVALALGVEMNGGYAGVYLKSLSIVIVDSHGDSSVWEPFNAGAISGRLDPFVILLVPRAELVFPLSLSQMMAARNPGIEVLPRGPITVKAKLTCAIPVVNSFPEDIRGIVHMPFWSGVTYSNPLRLS